MYSILCNAEVVKAATGIDIVLTSVLIGLCISMIAFWAKKADRNDVDALEEEMKTKASEEYVKEQIMVADTQRELLMETLHQRVDSTQKFLDKVEASLNEKMDNLSKQVQKLVDLHTHE